VEEKQDKGWLCAECGRQSKTLSGGTCLSCRVDAYRKQPPDEAQIIGKRLNATGLARMAQREKDTATVSKETQKA
jgi:hypothetical protein